MRFELTADNRLIVPLALYDTGGFTGRNLDIPVWEFGDDIDEFPVVFSRVFPLDHPEVDVIICDCTYASVELLIPRYSELGREIEHRGLCQ